MLFIVIPFTLVFRPIYVSIYSISMRFVIFPNYNHLINITILLHTHLHRYESVCPFHLPYCFFILLHNMIHPTKSIFLYQISHYFSIIQYTPLYYQIQMDREKPNLYTQLPTYMDQAISAMLSQCYFIYQVHDQETYH